MRGFYVASAKQMVALLGLDNAVVFTTNHVVLVARREDADSLRRLVARLKEVAPALTEDYQKVAPHSVADVVLDNILWRTTLRGPFSRPGVEQADEAADNAHEC
jgi:hypothetical protein